MRRYIVCNEIFKCLPTFSVAFVNSCTCAVNAAFSTSGKLRSKIRIRTGRRMSHPVCGELSVAHALKILWNLTNPLRSTAGFRVTVVRVTAQLPFVWGPIRYQVAIRAKLCKIYGGSDEYRLSKSLQPLMEALSSDPIFDGGEGEGVSPNLYQGLRP